MEFRSLTFNRALTFRLALILAGMLVFVIVGFIAPTLSQRELWREFWPVFAIGAAMILAGVSGDK